MIEFDSPGAFAAFLSRVMTEIPIREQMAMDLAAELIQHEAKGMLGHYQGQAGPFAAWPELAERTKIERTEQGYSENEPLRRSGLLEAHIERSADAREARVGVPDLDVSHDYDSRTENIGEIAVDLEFGTWDIPPRSFLGAAAFKQGEGAAALVGSIMSAHIAGLPLVMKKRP
jgi:hypothetical protein